MADYTAPTWFNLSSPHWMIPAPHRAGKMTIRLWNLHRRHSKNDGRWWGVGVLQIGRRHLAYIGRVDDREGSRWQFCLFFLGQTR
jgi:hypothetical protein